MRKILFICTVCPIGSGSGAGARTLQTARLLERLGELTVVGASSRPWSPEQIAEMQTRFRFGGFFSLQRDARIGAWRHLRRQLQPSRLDLNRLRLHPRDEPAFRSLFEAADVRWIHTMKLANAFRRLRWPRTLLDIDDIPSEYHRLAGQQSSQWREKLRRCWRASASRRDESIALQRFDALAVCKEEDRSAFGHSPRTIAIPNGLPLDPTPPQRHPLPRRLGMMGVFTHLPNIDGLQWFAQHVWPAVLSHLPDAELRVMGRNSQEVCAALSKPGIHGLGFVPDARSEMASWSAMIVPTRLGGGTHLKVVEALAHGVPLVTTTHGSRGFALQHGHHAMVTPTPTLFAEACRALLQDQNLGAQLASRGLDLFRTSYSWDAIQSRMEAALHLCAGTQPQQEPALI